MSVSIDLELGHEFLPVVASEADEEGALYGEEVEEPAEAV